MTSAQYSLRMLRTILTKLDTLRGEVVYAINAVSELDDTASSPETVIPKIAGVPKGRREELWKSGVFHYLNTVIPL